MRPNSKQLLTAERFDRQAEDFDRRAGLDPGAARQVALAVMNITAARTSDVVLEIGAGTGGVGVELARLGTGYLGLDLSLPMLRVFKCKLVSTQRTLLLRADADHDWPLQDGAVSVVLASRSAHLLERTHLLDEVRRVCKPRGYFLIGRIAHEPTCIKSRLRDERLRRRSRADPIRAGRGEGGRHLIDFMVNRGGVRLPKHTAATWSGMTSAERVIHEWEKVSPAELNFDSLRAWARREFGDLHRMESYTEQYTLDGVQLARVDRMVAR